MRHVTIAGVSLWRNSSCSIRFAGELRRSCACAWKPWISLPVVSGVGPPRQAVFFCLYSIAAWQVDRIESLASNHADVATAFTTQVHRAPGCRLGLDSSPMSHARAGTIRIAKCWQMWRAALQGCGSALTAAQSTHAFTNSPRTCARRRRRL